MQKNTNPHNIVLNQMLDFSQTSFNRTSQFVGPLDNNMKSHWADVMEHYRKFSDGLKMFELIDVNSPMENEVREKVSKLLDVCQYLENTEIQDITQIMNRDNSDT